MRVRFRPGGRSHATSDGDQHGYRFDTTVKETRGKTILFIRLLFADVLPILRFGLSTSFLLVIKSNRYI